MKQSASIENAIIIKNKTRLEQLQERFNTKAQARFYITSAQKKFYQSTGGGILSKKSSKAEPDVPKTQHAEVQNSAEFTNYEQEHEEFQRVLDNVVRHVGKQLKTKIVEQSFLPNYIFSDNDLIIVIGQDGLVANTAKYARSNPIIGINPSPQRYDGVLLPFTVDNYLPEIQKVVDNIYSRKLVSMAQVTLNDGQQLLAFNDFFVGVSNHGSARYRIDYAGISENQSSSGIIISTGAGSTGWMSSLINMANGINRFYGLATPVRQQRLPMDTDNLVFFVREPFVSKTSQANLVAGLISREYPLVIESMMPHNGVIFSDGIQNDYIAFNSGAMATISLAAQQAVLVSRD